MNPAEHHGDMTFADIVNRVSDLLSPSPLERRRQEFRRQINDPSGRLPLHDALQDPDWEIRATAMLAAARCNDTSVGKLIRKLQFPATSSEGLEAPVRSILKAMRAAALEHLGGEPLPNCPSSSSGELVSRPQRWLHLRQCVAGSSVTTYDQVFLLAYSLTHCTESGTTPRVLPNAVFAAENEYRLRKLGMELSWVPAVSHWLGSDESDLPFPNPVRRFTPPSGFWIARSPLTQAGAKWIMSDSAVGMFDTRSSQDAEIHLCSAREAATLCEQLSKIEGAPIRLPTAEEWEAAARGTDGRRHPWGNGFEGDPTALPSPWGLQHLFGVAPQWVSDGVGRMMVSGKDRRLRCAARTSVSVDDCSRYAVRPLVRLN